MFMEGQLTHNELAYMADILQFSEGVRFEAPGIEDIVAEFTDPEINGQFSVKRAKEVVNETART